MKPLILKVDEKGKPLVTAEDIQHMVELAYNEGFKDGSKGSSITYTPSVNPTWPPSKWNEITCSTNGDCDAR